MRKILFLVFLPSFIFAQYWGERVTEKSYESSDLFFNSYYLNTIGIYNFRDVSTGLFDDPFLRLHLNPALLPEDSTHTTEIYLDFRGDRTEAEVIQYNYYPPYYYNASYDMVRMPVIDPRWYSVTRTEPEPVFSLGILSRPFGEKVMIGATYQMLYRQEPYYQTPTGIYNSRYGRNMYGDAMFDESAANVPVIDRYSGSDEMLTSGQLFAAFLGYQLTSGLSVGANINTVYHSREGQYANLNDDPYSSNDNDEWFNTNSVSRNSDYNHIDFSVGADYRFNPKFSAGIKAGILDGTSNQDYARYDSSIYYYNYNKDPDNWSYSFNVGNTRQDWKHEGTGQYGAVNLNYKINRNDISFYYAYRKTDIDLQTTSQISDTAFYQGEWTSNNSHSEYNSHSHLSDSRHSSGNNEIIRNEAMISARWRETEHLTIYMGFLLSKSRNTIHNAEPVIAGNHSYYYHSYDDFEDNYDSEYTSTRSGYENKRLVWKYKADNQTIQIPVVLNFHVTESWNILLGINRMWKHWDITDQTTAYFTNRTTSTNGDIESENNFGERYTQPDQKFTDNMTEFMTGLSISLTPKFRINVLVEPDNEPDWRIAQWWLSFRATL